MAKTATYNLQTQTITLGGATVVFNMRHRDGGPTVLDRVVATIDPSEGVVGYDWEFTDTANAGRFEAEFEVTYADGAVETFPNDGFIVVQINGDIG